MSFVVTLTTRGGAIERISLRHAANRAEAIAEAAKAVGNLVDKSKIPLDAMLTIEDSAGEDMVHPMSVAQLLQYSPDRPI